MGWRVSWAGPRVPRGSPDTASKVSQSASETEGPATCPRYWRSSVLPWSQSPRVSCSLIAGGSWVNQCVPTPGSLPSSPGEGGWRFRSQLWLPSCDHKARSLSLRWAATMLPLVACLLPLGTPCHPSVQLAWSRWSGAKSSQSLHSLPRPLTPGPPEPLLCLQPWHGAGPMANNTSTLHQGPGG